MVQDGFFETKDVPLGVAVSGIFQFRHDITNAVFGSSTPSKTRVMGNFARFCERVPGARKDSDVSITIHGIVFYIHW